MNKGIHKRVGHELKITTIKPTRTYGCPGLELFDCVGPLCPGYWLPGEVVLGHEDLGKLSDFLPI